MPETTRRMSILDKLKAGFIDPRENPEAFQETREFEAPVDLPLSEGTVVPEGATVRGYLRDERKEAYSRAEILDYFKEHGQYKVMQSRGQMYPLFPADLFGQPDDHLVFATEFSEAK